eukprot:3567310-Prymnesium_polylepis.1
MRCPAGTSTCAHTVWAASKAVGGQSLRSLCTLSAGGIAKRVRALVGLVLGVPCRVLVASCASAPGSSEYPAGCARSVLGYRFELWHASGCFGSLSRLP